MEFDFLPKLPKSNLDDRAFEDLVEECLLRIPRYCPEWTNYNPSDPGVTLIELFAWLTDQMLLRFNQVPRRNYVTFLELLGIRLNPPKPAQTDATFYLSTSLAETYTIPAGVEVATLRTETEEAIVFSTDKTLSIGTPKIRHFLTAEIAEERPSILRDRFSGLWTLQPNEEWEGPQLDVFEPVPQLDNSFYLVFDPEQPIEGNVLAVTFRGEAATPTGINPKQPPRRWEAWNGTFWEPVLLAESDDKTEGFSFSEVARTGGDSLQGVDIILHMPKRWPVNDFVTYRGRWLRCVYTQIFPSQPGYLNSPRIFGASVRAIGGTVGVTQSMLIANEILGESDGNPGQTFQLQSPSVLPRREGEHLLVTPPGGLPQIWQEVSDFSESAPDDLHYTLDSITGEIQFGPLIREPTQLQAQTRTLSSLERRETNTDAIAERAPTRQGAQMKRHYGAVPPRGSTLVMVAYRTGGGQQGNVQKGTIKILKSAVPYVASVTNHRPARDGADAESLDAAVIRVPKMLRTRDRAVTTEDFETLALQAGRGAIARSLCLPTLNKEEAGTVQLILVPQVSTEGIEREEGIDPNGLTLSPELLKQILAYLDERRLLGVEVRCRQPDYVGVAVQTEIALEPEYKNPAAQQEILSRLQVSLYRFLNPLTGGPEGKGWPFGRPVYASDIINLFQAVPGVRYQGTVQLFELRKQGDLWARSLPKEPIVDPGPLGLICSWRDDRLRSGHVINLI